MDSLGDDASFHATAGANGGGTSQRRNWTLVCSTLFDVRGNTFADEMASRAAKGVEVLPSQASSVQTIGTAFSAQPKLEFLPPRTPVHRKTRQQKRNELLEPPQPLQDTRSKEEAADEKSFRCARRGRAGSFPTWEQEPTTCSAMLAVHEYGWVVAPTCHVPFAVAERSSDDEDPFDHGGALEADEENCASTQR